MSELGLRAATNTDYHFIYEVQKITMWEYVDQTWGWDEAVQQARFEQKFDPTKNQIIVTGDTDIGVFWAEPRPNAFFLAKIYILPAYQGRGLGSRLIESTIKKAAELGVPVSLRVLKTNPARRLYQRLGFEQTQEDDAYFYMQHVDGDNQ